MDAVSQDEVGDLVLAGMTHEKISAVLKNQFPSQHRGLSERSVRRFCAVNGIHKPRGQELDAIVTESVAEVHLA